MYTSGAYGRPIAGAQQGGCAQYPSMQAQQQGGTAQYPGRQGGGVQYPGMQPQQPTYASPYSTPQQTPTSARAGGFQDGGAGRLLETAAPALRPTAVQLQPQPAPAPVSSREQMLDQKVRQLEQTVADKDAELQDLRAAIARARAGGGSQMAKTLSARGAPGMSQRSGSGFRPSGGAAPSVRYTAIDQEDPVDIRLEEFYNSTDSAVQFRRINKGFYRFGDSIVELNIINHKLMAKTEDGWNRGKFGPVEKFLTYYEGVERGRMGMSSES